MSTETNDFSDHPSTTPYVKSKCPDCDFVPPTRHKWEEHRLTHSGERPFACPTCDSSFPQKHNRDDHVKRVHLKADRIACSWSGCEKTFSYANTMRMHVSSVHMKERIACPVAGCTHTSTRKASLRIHINAVHKKERRFICSVEGCSFRSAKVFDLRKHKRIKHEGRQVACPYDGCAFRTLWPEYLKCHEDSVHKSIFRYTCHVCGRRFYQKSNFRKHQQQVHAKQGHPVADCASCQEDLKKGSKRSSLASQEEQPSSLCDGVSDLLTSVHLDMHLLSSGNQ